MFAEECLWAKFQHLFWQIVSYFAEKVNTLFAFRGKILLKNCNAPCRGRRAVDPPACGTERLDEWYSFPTRTVGAANMSRLTWFTLCAITWFTPSVVGVYQKVSSFKCVNTFVNVNPPYAEFSKNQGNLSLGTGFTHSDFFSTKSLT